MQLKVFRYRFSQFLSSNRAAVPWGNLKCTESETQQKEDKGALVNNATLKEYTRLGSICQYPFNKYAKYASIPICNTR